MGCSDGRPDYDQTPVLEQVIDYVHSDSRSALLDVYLLKECSFYVGTSSGITDTAFLLGKSVVLTNMTSWINLLPRNLVILRYSSMYTLSENRFLSIQEWLMQASSITRENWLSPDWCLVENSEEEITSVVKERLAVPSYQCPTHLQQEFRKAHVCAVQEMSKTFRFDSSELENCNDWFRFASRILGWRGEISAEFLEKNWFKSSRMPN